MDSDLGPDMDPTFPPVMAQMSGLDEPVDRPRLCPTQLLVLDYGMLVQYGDGDGNEDENQKF